MKASLINDGQGWRGGESGLVRGDVRATGKGDGKAGLAMGRQARQAGRAGKAGAMAWLTVVV